MDEYISNLKKDFNKAMEQMHSLERESHEKELSIREWETKYRLFEQRVEI